MKLNRELAEPLEGGLYPFTLPAYGSVLTEDAAEITAAEKNSAKAESADDGALP